MDGAVAAAYTDAVHMGLWCIAVVSVLGAIAVGLLARERTEVVEPVTPDKAEVG
jgi:hypothetical protein